MEWEDEDREQQKSSLEERVIQDKRQNCQGQQCQKTEHKSSYGECTEHL